MYSYGVPQGGKIVGFFGNAVATLSNERAPIALDREWRTQRAGSLASLNHLAVAAGVRLLEDLAAERITRSQWLRLTYDEVGCFQVAYPAVTADPACPLCARAGRGDFALGSMWAG
jgi:hypothetical protein